MNIKDEIFRIRNSNGLTQESFAEIIGISRQSVTKWENGESLPEISKLITISDKFKVSLDSIIKGSNPYTIMPITENNDNKNIIDFLCTSKKSTYAAKADEISSSRLKSHDLEYLENEYRYLDSFFGGEKFIGEETVWVSDIPVWSMNYMGRVLNDSFSGDFLKECLLNVSNDLPYRGPRLYTSGEYIYHCKIDGEFNWFKGEEEIYYKKDRIYECIFHGGSIK